MQQYKEVRKIKKKKKKRLEKILFEFIEETAKEPLLESNVEILPAMVRELRELQKD